MAKQSMARWDKAHSMRGSLCTFPGLLEHPRSRQARGGLGWLDIPLALIAGSAHAASIAWPFAGGLAQGQPVWWLQLFAFLTLAWQLQRCNSVKRGAWLGWLFSAAMQCATWWWLFVSLHTYGGLAAPLAVLAILGLAGFLALYHALACGLFIALKPINSAGSAIFFAALWLMAELARVQFFTGFPWGESGYAQLDGPFINLAKVVGVHGLTFGVALLGAAIGGLLQRRRALAVGGVLAGVLLAMAASLALDAGGSSMFTAAYPAVAPDVSASAARPFTVTLLQGNIPQDEKFEGGSGIPDALQWYGDQLQAAKTTLVVTPETAIPLLPVQLPPGYLDAMVKRFVQPTGTGPYTAALVGLPLGNSYEGYANSSIGLKPEAPTAEGAPPTIYRYDKHHLVPFGEFVHPLFKWFLRIVNIPLTDFNRGAVGQASFEWQGQRLAPNICYEDLFGEELGKRFLNAGQAPTMFVNISNIGWFGNTIAIDQHLAISRMRALEFERPMLRATNTGATAIIDHRGQVTHALPRYTRAVLVGEVEGRSGLTPYAWWVARYGLWPLWGLGLLVLTGAAWAQRRRRP